MKTGILRAGGWLLLAGGIALAGRTAYFALQLGAGSLTVIAAAYLISGLLGWALLTTVADIADKLMPAEPEQPLYRLPPKVDEPRTTSATTSTTRVLSQGETEDERMDRVYGKVKRPGEP